MGCSFSLCLGRKNGKQFYIMPRTKKGVQFYVVLRTEVGCSFTSCPERRSDAVLCHAQDEKGGAVLRHAQDENKFKTPSISCHEPGVLWFYLGTLHLVWLRGNYTKKNTGEKYLTLNSCDDL